MFCPCRYTVCHSRIFFHRHNMKLRMLFQKTADRSLVFLRCKGTGRVNHTSSRPEHGGRTCKNFLLPRRTDLNIFRPPLLTRLFIFAKHSLPGTRGIYHDPVKIFRKHSRKCLRTLVCHHHIFYTHPFHILGKNLCPRRMNLIADKEPFSLHRCRNLCTFAPRCRT